jgi:RNA polymerase sigma-70 factor (ECF subfamily)
MPAQRAAAFRFAPIAHITVMGAHVTLDDAEIEALLSRIEGRVRTVLERMNLPQLQPHAEDIAQDVRLRLWRILADKSEVRFPASYLHRIVVTTSIDAIRSFQVHRDRSQAEPLDTAGVDGAIRRIESPEPGPDVRAHERGLVDAVCERLRELSPEARRIVVLHAQGFTTHEIARLMHQTEPRVRNHLYRILPGLRRGLTLEAPGDDD